MREKNFSNLFLGGYLEMSPVTIGKFRKGKTNPHHETLDKIENWLKEEGALTRLNLPVVILPPEPPPDTPPVDQTDREQLADMGILPGEPTMRSERKHYACAFFSDFDFAQVVTALMNSPIPEAEKKRLLGQLFTQDFPSLAVK